MERSSKSDLICYVLSMQTVCKVNMVLHGYTGTCRVLKHAVKSLEILPVSPHSKSVSISFVLVKHFIWWQLISGYLQLLMVLSDFSDVNKQTFQSSIDTSSAGHTMSKGY